MGMDYKYAGSASYPRFNKELTAVIALFGGTPSTKLIKEQEAVPEGSIAHWMGEPMFSCKEKFTFTQDVPDAFKKWANNPYNALTWSETNEIYALLQTKRNEVEAISSQIMHEFDELIECNDLWDIS